MLFSPFKLAKCQRRPLGKVSEVVLLPIVGNCTVHNIAVNFPMNYTTLQCKITMKLSLSIFFFIIHVLQFV